jgi:ribokinase
VISISRQDRSVRVAVIGHVEWVEFLRVDHVPSAGEIVHAASTLEVPAGGGAVAAVQLARWTGACRFYTALGADPLGHRAAAALEAHGLELRAVFRDRQRRAVTLVDAARERTIVVIGDRLVPRADDPLPWDELAAFDTVYVTGGDVGALRAARRARRVVATSRILPLLREAAIELDVLVGSANDPAERYAPGDLDPAPRLVVRTDGARGGWFASAGGAPERYAAVPAVVTGDTYGAGDTFAAALALAVAEHDPALDPAAPRVIVERAARRAVEVLAFDGPYPPGQR